VELARRRAQRSETVVFVDLSAIGDEQLVPPADLADRLADTGTLGAALHYLGLGEMLPRDRSASKRTVENHISNSLRELGPHNRVQLAR
jgi:hypothetical protein